ncbi:hypothetical protein [Alicyclobacillus fastidiosus]|uniref:Uncharacterized protein n=1 Tax=Alicyclobacillus fastidiosus TaxID=392011 RepID=A0ABV5ACX3_9BACL|nr:hypothetical protein [Alicyclobacillus fastidiosus]WEH08849.1 hypothetical protein PYS47_19490 [Alicyclobacillus fastidiosus]
MIDVTTTAEPDEIPQVDKPEIEESTPHPDTPEPSASADAANHE